MNSLEKRHKCYLPTSPIEVGVNESAGFKSFSRLIAINKDIDVLYPYVNGRRLSDVEALSLGYVPDTFRNKLLSNFQKVSNGVDNSALSDGDIAKQARLNSVSYERSERVTQLKSAGLFDTPPASSAVVSSDDSKND